MLALILAPTASPTHATGMGCSNSAQRGPPASPPKAISDQALKAQQSAARLAAMMKEIEAEREEEKKKVDQRVRAQLRDSTIEPEAS